ncbi:phage holin family protein [Peptoniphilus mikwangii]|uniref:phage holin family protein n=1 Tax=Peptoniphilus mikwangii TaxID=1354300 RepID=UPI00041C8A3C|nr:phage holin family protein [Peptoniphilus mikwangii]
MGKLIVKILVSAVAICIAALLSPMTVSNYSSAVVAAIIIGILDWLITKFTGIDASPKGRGAIGFITAALILYITGKIVDGFSTGIIGAFIGAFILGIVDAVIPPDKRPM